MDYNPADIATRLAGALQEAWNVADAEAFGARFAPFAEFVSTRSDFHRGRRAITWGHAALFETMFKDSVVKYEVINARLLMPGLLICQIAATLNAPQGPMAGENNATISIVARERDGDWLIELFHNTLVPPDAS